MKINEVYNDVKRFIKKYIVLIVLFVGIPIILCLGYLYFKSSIAILDFLQRKNKEYTMVETKDKINGVILSIY
jgi:hypothetical protein